MLNGSAMTDCCAAASHIYRQNGLQCQRGKELFLWLYLNKVVGDKTLGSFCVFPESNYI